MKTLFGLFLGARQAIETAARVVAAMLEGAANCFTPKTPMPIAVAIRRGARQQTHPVGHHRVRGSLGGNP
jgi:hypothetical protein